MCITKTIDKCEQAFGLLKCSQVLALEILDQRNLGYCPIVHLHLDARQLLETDLSRRPVAPLTGDDHEAATHI